MPEIGFIKNGMYSGMSGVICRERVGYLIIELFSKYQKIIKRKYPGFEEKVVWICERNVDRIGVGDCVVIDGSIGKIIRLSEIDRIVEIGGKEKLVYLSEIGLWERLLKI